jgi:hypothetical protein
VPFHRQFLVAEEKEIMDYKINRKKQEKTKKNNKSNT